MKRLVVYNNHEIEKSGFQFSERTHVKMDDSIGSIVTMELWGVE